jgi:MFS family permease
MPAGEMTHSLSIGIVLRRALHIYAEQARTLLMAAFALDGALLLDRVRFKSSPELAIVAVIVNLIVIGLFVAVVVLVVADAYDSGSRRGARELLAGAWAVLGPLLIVGLLAGLVFTFLSAIATIILSILIASVVLNAGVGVLGLIVGLLLVPVLVLVPELFLLTIWSVIAAVVVLERPGGLHAFGRSRELVRGNGWRVLALILVLAFPLTLAAGEIERTTRTAGSAPATVIQLLVATLIAPIPAIIATVLYFELRRGEPTPVHAVPTAPLKAPPDATIPSI